MKTNVLESIINEKQITKMKWLIMLV